MKKKGLPFTIGEQYELHEFELVEVETVLIGKYEYDVYRCSKKIFDGLELDGLMDVKLYYNADILARLTYIFKGKIYIDSIKTQKLQCQIESETNCLYDKEKNITTLDIIDLKHVQ